MVEEILMIPPIFTIEDCDVLAFDSVEAAENFHEAANFEGDMTVAYDSKGRLLHVACIGNKIELYPIEEEPSHVDELSNSLRNFLTCREKNKSKYKDKKLPELVKAFEDSEDYVLDADGKTLYERKCLKAKKDAQKKFKMKVVRLCHRLWDSIMKK